MAADSGMNTCPSPEIADSRKRPLDADSENGDIKRSHFSSVKDLVTALPLANGHSYNSSNSGGDGTYHFKVLVPSMAAGAIIGKGGETIAQLQKDTGSRVKMSKSHDFYPGTSERVCMITGTVEAIMTVLEFIMDKIREKPDFVKPFTEVDTKLSQDRDRQVKILVPNSTAGMIIGKAGVYIKQMKEQSGSYVQISQKAKDVSLQERCITVLGDKEQNKKACMMILQKVVDDPLSGSCPNTSYAAMAGPVANFNPTGSPYAHNQQDVDMSQSHAISNSVLSMNGSSAASHTLNLTINLGAPNIGASALSQQMLDHIKLSLRNFGYTELGCQEICAALGLLAKHGVLGLGLGGGGGMPTQLGGGLPPQLPPAPLPQHAYFPMHDQSAMFGTIGQVSLGGSPSPTTRGSLERFAEVATFEAAFRPQAVAPISLNGGFGLSAGGGVPAALLPLSQSPTPADAGAKDNKDTKDIEIPEVIVGAILGPGGKSLTEIQKMSGANIQISKKGTFAPGTRNRIVTITGSIGAISNAQCLIEQKVQEEDLKRTRHNTLSGIMQ